MASSDAWYASCAGMLPAGRHQELKGYAPCRAAAAQSRNILMQDYVYAEIGKYQLFFINGVFLLKALTALSEQYSVTPNRLFTDNCKQASPLDAPLIAFAARAFLSEQAVDRFMPRNPAL